MSFSDSPLWEKTLKDHISRKVNVLNFKKTDGANSRISQYNPSSHGLLFLKNIIFHMASHFSKDEIKLLNLVPNRHVGGGEHIL